MRGSLAKKLRRLSEQAKDLDGNPLKNYILNSEVRTSPIYVKGKKYKNVAVVHSLNENCTRYRYLQLKKLYKKEKGFSTEFKNLGLKIIETYYDDKENTESEETDRKDS